MLDHVTIGVSDLERSKAFYDRPLRRLQRMAERLDAPQHRRLSFQRKK